MGIVKKFNLGECFFYSHKEIHQSEASSILTLCTSFLPIGDFELSQSYLFFYDTLEKANYYLESMIDVSGSFWLPCHTPNEPHLPDGR
jgi:aminopeptidase C